MWNVNSLIQNLNAGHQVHLNGDNRYVTSVSKVILCIRILILYLKNPIIFVFYFFFRYHH